MKILDLSIVICNYNTEKLLKETLSSIYRHTRNVSFEIIVVDDGSTDGSAAMVRELFPKVIVAKNAKNLGYSKSCNIGTKLSKGEYILHLNSDVNFTSKTSMDLILKFMEKNPNIGICGCKIVRNDGSLDLACRHAVPTLKNSFFQMFSLYKLFPKIKSTNYYMTYLPDNKITKVGGLGAFMLIRRKLIEKIGYLDEDFFIYCEDTDYCYRAIKAGWDLYYFPEVMVKHVHGGTTNQFRIKALLYFHKGIFMYYKKHHLNKSFFLLNIIVYLGIFIRLTLYIILELTKILDIRLKKIRTAITKKL
ncbi:MAG: glycosyltransferase family 2 protein [Candidatus Parcubacteria bacterium]|nr:glycosyltransferase family 2 protein [Candidatus Parcubacteria bacterium]